MNTIAISFSFWGSAEFSLGRTKARTHSFTQGTAAVSLGCRPLARSCSLLGSLSPRCFLLPQGPCPLCALSLTASELAKYLMAILLTCIKRVLKLNTYFVEVINIPTVPQNIHKWGVAWSSGENMGSNLTDLGFAAV